MNVVVMRGVNDDELGDFVELTRDHAINVRFIEYMPFDGNVWSDTKMVTYQQMMAAVQHQFPGGLQRMQVQLLSCFLLAVAVAGQRHHEASLLQKVCVHMHLDTCVHAGQAVHLHDMLAHTASAVCYAAACMFELGLALIINAAWRKWWVRPSLTRQADLCMMPHQIGRQQRPAQISFQSVCLVLWLS